MSRHRLISQIVAVTLFMEHTVTMPGYCPFMAGDAA
jgi:hypothetical protein